MQSQYDIIIDESPRLVSKSVDEFALFVSDLYMHKCFQNGVCIHCAERIVCDDKILVILIICVQFVLNISGQF